MGVVAVVRQYACKCGALGFQCQLDPYTEETYFVSRDRLADFPQLTSDREDSCVVLPCCDHCVNHHGVDLCACGSGEAFATCDAGFQSCGTPVQTIGKAMSRRGWAA